MNKYQGALDRLLMWATNGYCALEVPSAEYEDLKEIMQELVDKATPKVIGTDREHTNFWCPTCGLEQIRKDNYCYCCGQKLDWSKEVKKIELSEEEKEILKIYINPYKDQIIAIARGTDYLREYLHIKYNDGSNKYVMLPNLHCFNNAELCKYYPLREFLERIENEE